MRNTKKKQKKKIRMSNECNQMHKMLSIFYNMQDKS